MPNQKLYVVCSRYGVSMNVPVVCSTLLLAQDAMKTKYTSTLADYDETDYDKELTYINDYNAVIATGSDWHEWTIFECNA